MTILVTGASGGIGSAVCKKFLQQGHEVVGLDIAGAALGHEHYRHLICDLREPMPPEMPEAEALVHCAGIQSQTEEDIRVNLTSLINFTEQAVCPEKIKAVVIIASASALTGSEFPHYAASKGGLVAYTKNLALRLAKHGAVVNCLCPGGVITPMNRHILESEELYEAVLEETLLHRWAMPEEIAEWVYFLAVVNRSMTGESLLIDNGEALKSNFIW